MLMLTTFETQNQIKPELKRKKRKKKQKIEISRHEKKKKNGFSFRYQIRKKREKRFWLPTYRYRQTRHVGILVPCQGCKTYVTRREDLFVLRLHPSIHTFTWYVGGTKEKKTLLWSRAAPKRVNMPVPRIWWGKYVLTSCEVRG